MRYWLLAFLFVGLEGYAAYAASPALAPPPSSVTETTSGFYGPAEWKAVQGEARSAVEAAP